MKKYLQNLTLSRPTLTPWHCTSKSSVTACVNVLANNTSQCRPTTNDSRSGNRTQLINNNTEHDQTYYWPNWSVLTLAWKAIFFSAQEGHKHFPRSVMELQMSCRFLTPDIFVLVCNTSVLCLSQWIIYCNCAKQLSEVCSKDTEHSTLDFVYKIC